MTAIVNHWWWRPGWAVGRRLFTFHLTFGQQPAVQQLALEVRERLAGFAELDLVPGRWLHCTTQGIGFADEIGEHDVMDIAAAALDLLALVRPAEVTVSSPRTVSEGVGSSFGPDGALNPARDALRSAIAAVRGPDQAPEGADWWPHVSYAYANANLDSAPVDAGLEGFGPVTVTLNTVDLIRLGRDRRLYEWETIASLPLGNS
jgi:hypothetical protein